jgi:hypothetical protein
MFIRWKRRENLKQRFPVSLYCVLLKSVRVNGVPKHKSVCYLGRVHEGDTTREASRVDFWDAVTPKLDAVPMSDAERAKIIKSIESLVPQLAAERAERLRKDGDAFYAGLNAVLSRRPGRRHRSRA